MRQRLKRLFGVLGATVMFLAVSGCASVAVRSHAYLGSPVYSPTDPATVRILPGEPKPPQAFDRLGEVLVGVGGSPSRERIETKLQKAAARLGANAVFIVSDRTRIYPFIYGDWWGPAGVAGDARRDIVAVAIRLK